jgi:hypothetical protein
MLTGGSPQAGETVWVTQVGLTSVLRFRWNRERPGWFSERGIGANVLLPIFSDDDRRFSTAFNFGDHLALGRSFGERMREELVFRVQHYSTGASCSPIRESVSCKSDTRTTADEYLATNSSQCVSRLGLKRKVSTPFGQLPIATKVDVGALSQ